MIRISWLNSWEFRKDCLGNLVRYADFGNRHSPFGWELDHIVSRANGGGTTLALLYQQQDLYGANRRIQWKARGDELIKGYEMAVREAR